MILPDGRDAGYLLVITGNMMSGKTEELIGRVTTLRRVEEIRAEAGRRAGLPYTPRRIGVYKHALDKRYATHEIASHSGRRMPAQPVSDPVEWYERVVRDDVQIAACDEVQFFLERDAHGWLIVQVAAELIRQGRWLILSGLDKDFRGMPFGPIGDLLALADERVSLVSVCVRCGSPAVLPQRLINGRPAAWDDPLVYPGASESYEPRCRRCHELEAPVPSFFPSRRG